MNMHPSWPQANPHSISDAASVVLPFETAGTQASSTQERPQSLTRYQYFFVPSHQTDEDDAECITKPGAFLRLGAYSDIEEESARTDGGLFAYYPSRYIARESGDATYKQASGSNAAQSCGITLACDGRVMLKAEEEIFIEATDLLDIHSGKDINLTADTGPITAATGNDFSVVATKKVSLRSGAVQDEPYTPPSENTSGDTGIEIIANEGKSDVFLEGKAIYLHAHGSQTTDIEGAQTNIVRSDTLDDVWGNAKSIFRGSQMSLYFAGGLSYRASASVNVSTAVDLNFLLWDFKFAAKTFEMIKWSCDLKEVFFGVSSVSSQLANLKLSRETLAIQSSDLATRAGVLDIRTNRLQTDMGDVKAALRTLNVQI